MRRRRYKSDIRNDFTKPLWRKALDKIWDFYVKFNRPIGMVTSVMLVFLYFHLIALSTASYIALTGLYIIGVYLFLLFDTKIAYKMQMEFLLDIFTIIYYCIYWDGIKHVIALLGHKFLGL